MEILRGWPKFPKLFSDCLVPCLVALSPLSHTSPSGHGTTVSSLRGQEEEEVRGGGEAGSWQERDLPQWFPRGNRGQGAELCRTEGPVRGAEAPQDWLGWEPGWRGGVGSVVGTW